MADPTDGGEADFERLADDDVVGATRRVQQIVAAVKEAHALGYGPPGQDADYPQTARGLADAFLSSVPGPVAKARTEWAEGIASYMTARGSPPAIAAAWVYFTEAFARMAEAYRAAEPPAGSSEEDPAIGEVVPLYTIDWQAIGPAVPVEMVEQFGRAAEVIEQALSSAMSENPLSVDEVTLLRGLTDGRLVSELAVEFGFAERSVYRILRNVWMRVGAASRSEGIAIVTARGWLDDDRGGDR